MANYDKHKLRHYIDVVSFVVDDTKLFLDTHPDNKEALEHFENYSNARKNAMKEYAEHFGPLTVDTASGDDYWQWVKHPWPWEMEG